MRQIGHFIGGKHVAGTSGRTADVYQPMDGSVIGKYHNQVPQPAVTDTEAKKPTEGASDREAPVQKPPGAAT